MNFLLTKENEWMIEGIIAVVVLFLVHFFLKWIIQHLRRAALNDDFRQQLGYILITPIKYILLVIGLFLTLSLVAKKFQMEFFRGYLDIFRNISIVMGITWILLRWKQVAFHLFFERSQKKHKKNFDPGSFHLLSKVATIVILFLSFLIILQIFGMNIGPLLAFGGIGAAVLGFAARDVIANFMSGLMIYISKPFTIGDTIELPEKNLQGTVEEVGWYFTQIRDLDKAPIYLPNSFFSSLFLMNLSRRTHRKIEEKILVRFEDFAKFEKFSQEMMQFFANDEWFDQSLRPILYVESIMDQSLVIQFRVYTLETQFERFLEIKQRVLEKVKEIFDRLEIKMPIATTQVEMIQK